MMYKICFMLILLIYNLSAKEILVIANQDFPLEKISKTKLKMIFLNKKHYIKETQILPINYSPDNPLRCCFEKNILKKSKRSLQRYWLDAHYHGRRPPKVVKSKKALLKYLQNIPGSIGYIDSNITLDHNYKILFKEKCL